MEATLGQANTFRSQGIDLLRGVAVLMVMMAHLAFSYTGAGGTPHIYPGLTITRLMTEGQWGVQLFLVISGYCIHIRWAKRADLDTRVAFLPFWKRRLLRLYPPYAVMVLFAAAATYALTRAAGAPMPAGALVTDVVVLLLLLQTFTDASARLGNPPFWSLALEEQLYLLYFPLLELRRRWGWRAALGVSAVVTVAWMGALELHWVPMSWTDAWRRSAPAYWFAWALGALAAESHLGHVQTPAWTRYWWLFLPTFAACLIVRFPLFDVVACVSFFLLVHGVVTVEKRRGLGAWARPFVRLGEISYGVYLAHNAAFALSKRFFFALGLSNPLVLCGRFLAGVCAGYLVYLVLERPAMARAQRIAVPLVPSARKR